MLFCKKIYQPFYGFQFVLLNFCSKIETMP